MFVYFILYFFVGFEALFPKLLYQEKDSVRLQIEKTQTQDVKTLKALNWTNRDVEDYASCLNPSLGSCTQKRRGGGFSTHYLCGSPVIYRFSSKNQFSMC